MGFKKNTFIGSLRSASCLCEVPFLSLDARWDVARSYELGSRCRFIRCTRKKIVQPLWTRYRDARMVHGRSCPRRPQVRHRCEVSTPGSRTYAVAWASCIYVNMWVAHVPGMPGTFSRHHGFVIPTLNTARASPTAGMLTSGFLWSQWRG